jgi:hypothetical protein
LNLWKNGPEPSRARAEPSFSNSRSSKIKPGQALSILKIKNIQARPKNIFLVYFIPFVASWVLTEIILLF